MKTLRRSFAAGAAVLAMSATAAWAETWDMPMAYPDSNFHSQNAKAFAECVAKGTDGDLEIVVHPGGSLFKGNEIKRAVQTGQAPIGERLLSAHENEEAVFGFDSVPFLATSFEASDQLWEAAKPTIEEILDEQNLVLLYSVPWPPQGLYTKKPLGAAATCRASSSARTTPRPRARRADGRGAGADRGGGADPGARHRRRRELHLLGRDRLRPQGLGAHDHWYDVAAWLPRNYGVRQQGRLGRRCDEATQQALARLRRRGRDGRQRRSRSGSTTGTRSSSPPTA